MHDLLTLLLELKRYIENSAANDQVADLCSIVAEEARNAGNLRIVRGAEAVARRALDQFSGGRFFDRDLSLREVNAMISSLNGIRAF